MMPMRDFVPGLKTMLVGVAVSMLCVLVLHPLGINAQSLQISKYETPGSYTYTVPAGVTSIQVEAWGAGGRGGTRTNNGGGGRTGGGGGGAYARSVINVTPGEVYYINVGLGSSSTQSGGSSWISLNSDGANPDVSAAGGSSGGNNATGASGGTQNNSVGEITLAGGTGASTSSGSIGGGGGSSAGPLAGGTSLDNNTTIGGNAPSGGGNGGNGATSSGTGFPGFFPGGGGGGGNGNGNAGGKGGDGMVVITPQSSTQFIYNIPNGSNYTWVAPAGVTSILVETWGAGGRGGRRTSNGVGGGGGGGAYSSSEVTVNPGDPYYIGVGEGQSSTGGGTPAAGGTSWFSSNSNGSSPSVQAVGGSSVGNNSTTGVNGGAGTTPGGRGANASGSNGGGGGSSAGPGGNGVAATNNSPTGATAPAGGGDGGNGRTGVQGHGHTGISPGGGGGGVYRSSNIGDLQGGPGAHGQVRITILAADLGVTTSASNMAPQVGSTVDLTFLVTNYGELDATNVVMTETLPSGLAYASHQSPSQGSVDLVNSKWNIGTLSKNQSATLTVTFTILSSGTYFNEVNVTADQFDLITANNNSIFELTPPTPTSNLRITKEADDYTPMVGDPVTFTLTAYNSGPHNATNVVVTDQLPNGLTYVSHSGGTYTDSNGQWSIGSLANGASATLTITATVAASGNYTNQATITGDQFDPATNNNTSSISISPKYPAITIQINCEEEDYDLTAFTDDFDVSNIPPGANLTWHTASEATTENIYSGNLANVPPGTYYLAFYDPVLGCYSLTTEVTIENNCADLGIEKTANNMTPTVGQTVTFTLTITNNGAADASGVTVVDEVPNGYESIANISNSGVWDAVERTITWSGLAIINTENQVLTYQVVVLAKGSGVSHTNTATITALDQTDNNPTNNTASLALNPGPSLLITNPMIRQRVRGDEEEE